MAEVVQLERKPPVAWIWLNRPEKLNAIDDDVLLQLLEAVRKIERDPELAVAVLSGRGRAFSAGGDIKAMEAEQAGDRGDPRLRLRWRVRARPALRYQNCR